MRGPPPSTLFPYTTLFRSCSSPRYSANLKCPLTYVNPVSAAEVIIVTDIASPSSPSVRFTAFEKPTRSEEHTSELQSRFDLVCRLLLEKKNLRRTLSRFRI